MDTKSTRESSGEEGGGLPTPAELEKKLRRRTTENQEENARAVLRATTIFKLLVTSKNNNFLPSGDNWKNAVP